MRIMPGRHSSEDTTWSAVLRDLLVHPQQLLLQWNWKSACVSAAVRSTIFFTANLPSGRSAAVTAFTTEIWLRLATSGFYGGLTQRLGRIEPEWQAVVAATVVLPLVSHGLEIAVHLARGTPELLVSILASASLTMLSTSFNVFAMRRGALTTGAGSQPLHRDLMRMPSLIAGFLGAPVVAARRRLARTWRTRSAPDGDGRAPSHARYESDTVLPHPAANVDLSITTMPLR